MDRCALFVDAGYVLADGAMAVHGTRRRESVTWDYEGLLQLLASVARERSGLPLLRCYWYEATMEGRRSADHDALADLPGVKLRLAKMRPGRREGVESEIHRDLETLARNKAISDAMVVSAEEDLAQVVSDVQDLGLRVTLLNIGTDGDWTISRALRQECDDIAEISSEHLRPYVELISGAEPARADERDSAPLIALRPTVNGHTQPGRTAAYAPVPIGSDNGHQPPPPSYDAPVVASYQSSVSQPSGPLPLASQPPRPDTGDQAIARDDSQAGEPAVADFPAAPPDAPPARPDAQAPLDSAARQEAYAGPVIVPAPADDQPIELPAARSRQGMDLSGYNPGAARETISREPSREPLSRESLSREPLSREPLLREPLAADAGETMHPVPVSPPGSAQIHRLPTRGIVPAAQAPGQPANGQPAAGQLGGGQPGGGQATAAQPVLSAPTPVQPAPMTPAASVPVPPAPVPPAPVPPAPVPSAPLPPMAPGAGYPPMRNGSYSGPQPVVPGGPPSGPNGLTSLPGGVGPQGVPGPVPPMGPVYTPNPGPIGPVGAGPAGPAGPMAYPGAQPSVSLAEAVQSAHDEGQEFGSTVARDAPALWLEAVLARKPRMPSDLEARLLQGSALPIDFLLHDEVRHALRRGFWDALERARR